MTRLPRALAWALALSAALAGPCAAHGIAGNRFFPATVAGDDPFVADELSLPTIAWRRGDEPGATETEVSGEYSKRLTSRLGISIGSAWTRSASPEAPSASGFRNLETTLKHQLATSAEHEAIVSAGVSVEWGGSGARRVGAERVSAVTPALYVGKGAGDLPDALAWARPLAVTGSAAYALPVRGHDEQGEPTARVFAGALAVEYSLAYLSAHVRDVGLPPVLAHLTPLVELSWETPVSGPGPRRTTGTLQPGVISSGRRLQLAAEAVVPINRGSGRGVGVVVQLHFYLDDIFPRSIGRPLW